MSILAGGSTTRLFNMTKQSNFRFTLIGDSLTNAAVQTNRMAHAILKGWQFGGSITAMLEPRVGTSGVSSAGFLDHASYESGDTNNTANATAQLSGSNSYGNYGDFAIPTPDEYFGIPLEGYNWYWDGTLGTTATYVARDLLRTANPISGSVNTFALVGTTPAAVVFRWLYYGATGMRSTYTATGALERRDFTTLEDRVDPTVDARPYWSEGDNPDTDVSPRSGGVKLGEANALWPDLITTGAVGGTARASYYSDKEGATPNGGHYNKMGIMAFQATSAADKSWIGGVQFELVGASSWTLAGFSENTASSSGTQKTFDNDNWLYFRDVTTISRNIPGGFLVIVDPEAVAASSVAQYTQNFVDKVTSADLAIGNPEPIVVFVIWPKTSARSVAEMIAWRDGIITGCNSRVNAGYINLFDYYKQEVPSYINSDGTHPNDESSANSLISDIITLMQISSGSTRNRNGWTQRPHWRNRA